MSIGIENFVLFYSCWKRIELNKTLTHNDKKIEKKILSATPFGSFE